MSLQTGRCVMWSVIIVSIAPSGYFLKSADVLTETVPFAIWSTCALKTSCVGSTNTVCYSLFHSVFPFNSVNEIFPQCCGFTVVFPCGNLAEPTTEYSPSDVVLMWYCRAASRTDRRAPRAT